MNDVNNGLTVIDRQRLLSLVSLSVVRQMDSQVRAGTGRDCRLRLKRLSIIQTIESRNFRRLFSVHTHTPNTPPPPPPRMVQTCVCTHKYIGGAHVWSFEGWELVQKRRTVRGSWLNKRTDEQLSITLGEGVSHVRGRVWCCRRNTSTHTHTHVPSLLCPRYYRDRAP